MFEGRTAIGYDRGYDAAVFYLELAPNPKNVEGIVEGCLERIGEGDPDGEMVLWQGLVTYSLMYVLSKMLSLTKVESRKSL